MLDYKPKVGDRVRITIEGEVQYLATDGSIETELTLVEADEIVSVDHIATPLPTKPGAVLFPTEVSMGTVITLNEDATRWRSPSGQTWPLETLRGFLERGTHYVAFEGVES